jgi:c-di-GMP-binding flagellar brake protein YcgR
VTDRATDRAAVGDPRALSRWASVRLFRREPWSVAPYPGRVGTVQSSRRRAPRRVTAWPGACRLRVAAGEAELPGTILDISAHGAFFAPADGAPAALTGRLEVNDKIALRFSEDGLSGLELPARVKWIGYSPTHRRTGIGVEFSHVPMA